LRLPVVLFFAAVLALGLAIHRDYGISWDEPFQRFTGAVTVKHLAERFAPSLVRGEATRLPALEDYVDRDHGTAFEVPAVVLEALLGLTDKRDIYMFRHLLTFLVCFAGIVAIYRLAERRFGDWRWGLLAAAFLVLSPRLFAESFYNSKDAVFMAAFAVATSTMIGFVLRPGLWAALLHGLATGIAIDIRLMAVMLPAATLAVLVLRALKRELALPRMLWTSAVYVAAACGATVAFWVWLWSDPVGNFLHAFASMAKFRWQGDTLYLGQQVAGSELPWHYITVWLALTTPLFYLALFAIGAVAILHRLASRGAALWRTDEELQDLIFLSVIVAPILTVIVLQSVLYGGWRHLYFIYPAFLLVAARGWHWLWQGAVGRLTRRALLVFTVLTLASVAIWMVRAHPLQNVYFNVLAGKNLKARFDLDYWGLANRKALEYILRHDPSPTIVVAAGSETPLHSSIDMLPPADRQRLRLADPGETARYVIDNYYGRRDFDGVRDVRDYDLLHEIIVDGEVVLSIFKRKT